MKNKISEYIDGIGSELVAMSDFIFDNPEVGNKEFKACELLCTALQ